MYAHLFAMNTRKISVYQGLELNFKLKIIIDTAIIEILIPLITDLITRVLLVIFRLPCVNNLYNIFHVILI